MSASCELFVFHTRQRCHSVFSCFDPAASFHERLVASEKVATRFPPVVDRTSGSFPRFPINNTLFKLRLTNSSWRESHCSRRHGSIQSMRARKQIHASQRFPLHTLHLTSHTDYGNVRRSTIASSTGRR